MTTTDTHDHTALLAPEDPEVDGMPSDSSPPAATAPTAADPNRRERRRSRGRTMRAWAIVLLIVVGAVALGVRQVDERLDRRDHVALGEVVLMADPVDVVSTSSASVVDIAVEPRQRVAAGDLVATIDAIRPRPSGGETRVRQRLVAPIDGVVAAVPTNAGAAVLAGGVVARLYDPEALHFSVELALEDASRLEVGMQGRVDSDVSGAVAVTVTSIEPALAGDDSERIAVIELVASDPGRIDGLLPGLVFRGWVDERTAR